MRRGPEDKPPGWAVGSYGRLLNVRIRWELRIPLGCFRSVYGESLEVGIGRCQLGGMLQGGETLAS